MYQEVAQRDSSQRTSDAMCVGCSYTYMYIHITMQRFQRRGYNDNSRATTIELRDPQKNGPFRRTGSCRWPRASIRPPVYPRGTRAPAPNTRTGLRAQRTPSPSPSLTPLDPAPFTWCECKSSPRDAFPTTSSVYIPPRPLSLSLSFSLSLSLSLSLSRSLSPSPRFPHFSASLAWNF